MCTVSASSAALALGIIQIQNHSFPQTPRIQQQINLTLASFPCGIYYDSELQLILLLLKKKKKKVIFKNSKKHLLSQRVRHFLYL